MQWLGPLAPEACWRLACDGPSPGSWSPATPPTTTPRPHGTADRTAWRPGRGSAAAAAPPGPWWRPDPTPGGGPDHPGGDRRPTGRPGRPRRRLCGGRLPPAPSLVRGPSSPPLAPGGPTDLANLALICRAHHRAVHEGGWRLTRDPDGQLTATHRIEHTTTPRSLNRPATPDSRHSLTRRPSPFRRTEPFASLWAARPTRLWLRPGDPHHSVRSSPRTGRTSTSPSSASGTRAAISTARSTLSHSSR